MFADEPYKMVSAAIALALKNSCDWRGHRGKRVRQEEEVDTEQSCVQDIDRQRPYESSWLFKE